MHQEGAGAEQPCLSRPPLERTPFRTHSTMGVCLNGPGALGRPLTEILASRQRYDCAVQRRRLAEVPNDPETPTPSRERSGWKSHARAPRLTAVGRQGSSSTHHVVAEPSKLKKVDQKHTNMRRRVRIAHARAHNAPSLRRHAREASHATGPTSVRAESCSEGTTN